MINEETYNEIERYVDDVMTASEKAEFEFRLFENPDLQKQVNMLQVTRDFLQYESLGKEKAAIKKAQEQYFGTTLFRKISLVLLVSITVAALLWALPKNQKGTKTEIDSTKVEKSVSVYSEHAAPLTTNVDRNSVVENSASDTTEPILVAKQAVTADGSENQKVAQEYTNTISIKENIQKTFPRDSVWSCGYYLRPICVVEASCVEKNSGSIKLTDTRALANTVVGELVYTAAKPPYVYSIEGGKFSAQHSFSFLKAGTYSIDVRDANGCTGKSDFVVEEKECVREINGIISYSQYTAWQVPTSGLAGKLMVYNAGGALVCEIDIDSNVDTWNGYDGQAQKLEAGAYYYRFIAGNTIVAQGSITILH